MRELSQDWRDLLRAAQIAFDLRKLLLCAACLLLQLVGAELVLYYTTLKAGTYFDQAGWRGIHLFQLHRLPWFLRDVWNMPGGERILLVIVGMVYFWVFFVFSYFGAAVFRMTAVEVGLGKRLGLAEARRFARDKFRAYFWTQGILLLAVLFFGGLIGVGGLLGRIPIVGPSLLAALFWVALALSACAVLLLVGLALGWDLMLATIAVEGTDQFDGISRGINYVFARPWRYLAYRVVGLGSGIASILVVVALAGGVYAAAVMMARVGMGHDFDRYLFDPARFVWHSCLSGEVPPDLDDAIDPSGSAISGGIFIFVSLVYWLLVAGYALSVRVGVGTTTYLLLRRAVDGTDVTEIYTPETAPEFEFAPDFEDEPEPAKS